MGGPADPESARLASTLVRSPLDAVVELAFGEVTFAVEEAGTLAVVGAGRAERRSLALEERLTLAPRGGARLALAAPGGWDLPSLGADPEASLALGPGASLVAPPQEVLLARKLYAPERPRGEIMLRVVAGPQRGLWPDPPLDLRVTSLLDRRGVRLSGAPEHGHEIASEPCVSGVVQWTPGGELIVLGPDGPTIGGYPKPFVVIEADLPRVGQLLPGESVRLVELDLPDARAADLQARADLARRLTFLHLAAGAERG